MRVLFFILFIGTVATAAAAQDSASKFNRTLHVLFDSSRQRKIPFAVYEPVKTKHREVVILNHGYGGPENPDAYLGYSYITGFLASEGYCVISIEQEQPDDPPMPSEGNLQVLRMPFWETGARNINYVISHLRKNDPTHSYEKRILIGHSYGGDIAALYAAQNPKSVTNLITLDNRRMALPRTRQTRVLSLRSADQPADAGVLPTEAEAKKFGMTIVKLINTNHSDMDDHASPEQRKEICDYIGAFLKIQ